jgi:prophage regulatory protein
MIRRKEVEQLTGLSRSTIYVLMSKGKFPYPTKIATRAVAWRSDIIEQWIYNRPSDGGMK